jgi:hypothetical protein
MKRRRPRWYVLDGTEVRPVEDFRLAAQRFALDQRCVARTILPDGREVSTVFLGLDHNLSGSGPPLLFETAVFTEAGSDIIARSSTWAEAAAQHAETVAQMMSIHAPKV